MLKYFLLINIFFGSTLLLLAQENEKAEEGSISTDRPVQCETPTTVPKKYIQTELGGQFTQGIAYNSVFEQSAINGNILLKYGLFEHMELRISTNYIQQNQSIKDTAMLPVQDETQQTSGMDAPYLGFKFGLLQESGWKPNATLSLHSSVPIWGAEEFKTNTQNFISRLTLGKTIAGNWFANGGLEYGYFPTEDDYYFYILQTGYTFFEKLTAIAEFYGKKPQHGQSQDALNFALVYLINNNHQVDLSGGLGLGDNFYKHYFALGYSFRFHH